MSAPDSSQTQLLRGLLKRVSRSFYLSLRFLPEAVRDPLSVAYLLARTTDTVADTSLLPAEDRLASLHALAARIDGTSDAPVALDHLTPHQGDPAERELLARAADSLGLLAAMSASNRALVREVLAVIISGQELDLRRFQHASLHRVVALESAAELEDYIYRVAGCVGDFWTKVCFANLELRCDRTENEMRELGARFGCGLQLTNILRDLPRDLCQGRCYLPATELAAAGLTPADLLEPGREGALRPAYARWLAVARGHLQAGWAYANAFDRKEARLRISCALPVLIGMRTLGLLECGPILEPAQRIKVSRGKVRKLILATFLLHPVPSLWRRLDPFADR
jgi:farnesyl-diphosphate farnesyltransferase